MMSVILPCHLSIMRYFFCNSWHMLFMVLLCPLNFTLYQICVAHRRSMAQKGERDHGSQWISHNCKQCFLPESMAISISTKIFLALVLCILLLLSLVTRALWSGKSSGISSSLATKSYCFTLILSCGFKYKFNWRHFHIVEKIFRYLIWLRTYPMMIF